MHQAIPYRSFWPSIETKAKTPVSSSGPLVPPTTATAAGRSDVSASVSESAAIVFARKGCCMSHVVKHLLLGLGANPAVYEVDEQYESALLQELDAISGNSILHLPAVFIGGTFFGGLDQIMATHISGDLIPILKQARALWL